MIETIDKKLKRMKSLVKDLNHYKDWYYNYNESLISDYEFDELFDELCRLEKETNIIMSNSPTQTVGYEVKSELEKTTHSHPMLSLDKTKDENELIKFAGKHDCVLSCKMDGLTCLLTYFDGELIKAETRGNGEIGEDITHNAKAFENVPLKINAKGLFEIEGEAIITYDDFNKINRLIADEDKKYKNPRNLASGSVRQLDSGIAKERHIKFIAWKVPTTDGSYYGNLRMAKNLGFDVVPFYTYVNVADKENLGAMIEGLKLKAKDLSYPIDGLVMCFDNIKYGLSLGLTGHHPRHSIAYKFYDEETESQLKNIIWQVSKTGAVNPVAEFEPIELDGTTVERASLHNLNVVEEVLGNPYVGQKVNVYKANMIIPQIAGAEKLYDGSQKLLKPPTHCPVCHKPTEIKQENATKILYCTNPYCKAKVVKRLEHFASRDAMNIDGLSEATIEYLVNKGWVEKPYDLYGLIYRNDVLIQWYSADRFGSKSVNKLLDSIEKSKNTSFTRFLYSLSIDLVGKTASKQIEQHISKIIKKKKANMTVCEAFFKMITQKYNWSSIDGIGSKINKSIYDYFSDGETFEDIKYLSEQFEYDDKYLRTENNTVGNSSSISGKVFVVTGSVYKFKNRKELSSKIEELGGKVSGSVSNKTDYLINNDKESNSSKNKKAKELGIKIITEDEFIEMIK